MKIIKIKDLDGIEYHLNAKFISSWFCKPTKDKESKTGYMTGISTNHGWNYTIDGNLMDKLDKAMLNETGTVFNLTGDGKNVTGGD